MEHTTTQEAEMSDTTLTNSIRIAAIVSRQISNGMTPSNAMKDTARNLGISEAAVCHAVTIGQDFTQDLEDVMAA
jgi:hypothetical protein